MWSVSEYISIELKLRLVKAFVIPQFFFGVVLFRMAEIVCFDKPYKLFNPFILGAD
jgi:hypothetical protein